MRKMALLAVLFGATVFGLVGPAAAITNGQPDEGEHPYVGLVVFYDEGGEPLGRCSGTLLSSTVFLTAGHCTADAASARVYFDENVASPPYPTGGGVEGKPQTHPDFSFSSAPNTRDVGIVTLAQAVNLDTYGALPEAGTMDGLAKGAGKGSVNLEAVGYGLQGVKPSLTEKLDRYKAQTRLVNLKGALSDGYNIRTSSAKGGTCFGDSGGPILQGDTSNVVVGVTSFGSNQNCKGIDYAYRTDIEESLEFIAQFL